jgi:hypothetical protein
MAGCGEGGGGDSTTTTTSSATPDPGATELIITLDPDGKGGKPPVQEAVSCPGPDKPACEAIAALPPDATAEVPPDTACTEIYGGPDTLVVQGTINGEPVDARMNRGNGCEIERFDPFVPLLKALFGGYEPGQALGT